MSHKRTKKDVEDAYRRGFKNGFMVRPNPLAMILRAIWRKHELKKFKKAYLRSVKENKPMKILNDPDEIIGVVKSFELDDNGITADIEFREPPDA
jgi:hypothetical protein